ncbi:MAG: hypothetical protein EP338_09605 [Bacteroidetes bacterium]|nr:MAG: hypothetical protein EP338_09605 [Bacteroidota bacterium]
MNLDHLQERIRHPHSILESEIPSLKELCQKYPYAQSFSTLYLKALSMHKRLEFDEELKAHAYKITDRAKLFHLIRGESAMIVTEEQEIPAPIASEEQKIIEPIETISATKEEEIVEQEPENIVPEDSTLEESEPVLEKQDTEELDQFEKQLLSQAIASNYDLVQQYGEDLEEEEEQLETELSSQLEQKPDVAPDDTGEKSFTDWLKAGSTISEIPEKDKSQEAPEEVVREKKAFFSATKSAKDSVREDTLIYSETLASIYEVQGNYPKAIQAYEQLMLSNPEKKRYFAQKISDLKRNLDT